MQPWVRRAPVAHVTRSSAKWRYANHGRLDRRCSCTALLLWGTSCQQLSTQAAWAIFVSFNNLPRRLRGTDFCLHVRRFVCNLTSKCGDAVLSLVSVVACCCFLKPPSGKMAMLKLVATLCAIAAVGAVDRTKFRTCNDAGFCKRHRSKTSEPEVCKLFSLSYEPGRHHVQGRHLRRNLTSVKTCLPTAACDSHVAVPHFASFSHRRFCWWPARSYSAI